MLNVKVYAFIDFLNCILMSVKNSGESEKLVEQMLCFDGSVNRGASLSIICLNKRHLIRFSDLLKFNNA